jgi:HEAT repeat protein
MSEGDDLAQLGGLDSEDHDVFQNAAYALAQRVAESVLLNESLTEDDEIATNALVRAFQAKLATGPASLVRIAAYSLGITARREVVSVLLEALANDNQEYRDAIRSGLRHFGVSNLPSFIDALGHRNVRVREEVATLFRELLPYALHNSDRGTKGWVVNICRALIGALSMGDAQISTHAARALDRVVADLVDFVKSDGPLFLRAAAVEELGQIDTDHARWAVSEALKVGTSSVFKAAVSVMVGRGDDAAVGALAEALQVRLERDEGFELAAAAEGLACIRNSSAIPILIRGLDTYSTWYRSELRNALVKFGPAAIEALIAALVAHSNVVRQEAAQALVDIGVSSVEPLVRLLATDPSHAQAAACVLGRIGHAGAVPALRKAAQSRDRSLVRAAVESLGRLDALAAVEALLAAASHVDAGVRAAAAEALGRVKNANAVRRLITLLTDTNGHVRRVASDALAEVGSESVDALEVELLSGPAEARPGAARALGLIGGPGTDALLRALRVESDAIRAAAAEGLGKCSGRRVADALIAAFDDRNARVRLKSVAALANSMAQTPWARDEEGAEERASVVARGSTALWDMLTRSGRGCRQTAARALLKTSAAGLGETVIQGLRHENPQVRHCMAAALAREFEFMSGHFPAWFAVFRDRFDMSVSAGARAIIQALADLNSDEEPAIRRAASNALDTIRLALEKKRIDGPSDVNYMIEGPVPQSRLHLEVEEEILAAESARSTSNGPTRYTDFIVYDDTPARQPVPAKFPLRVDDWHWIEVAVRAKPLGIGVDGERETIPDVAGMPLHVWVVAEGDGFEITEPVQSLVVPSQGDSVENAWFRVRPLRPTDGPHDRVTLRFRLYYEFNLLEVDVITAVTCGKFARRVELESRTVSLRQERLEHTLDLQNLHPRSMHIDVHRNGDHFCLRFAIRNAASGVVEFLAPVRLTTDDLESDLITVRKTWYDVALSKTFTEGVEGDPDEFVSIVRRLATAGRSLWIKLFKRERGSALYKVGEWLQQHPLLSDSMITVSLAPDATSFVFPWTLLYDRNVPRDSRKMPDLDGFWGMRYSLEQHLPGVPPIETNVKPRVSVKLEFMLWEQFRNAMAHGVFLRDMETRSHGVLSVSNPPVTQADACLNLLTECDANVLYFYTHGYTRHRQADIGVGPDLALFISRYEALQQDSTLRERFRFLYESTKQSRFEADRSWIELTYGRLYLDELYDEIGFLSSQPLVFLNMCESAQVTPSLADSFVHFFLDRGARTVIGTECPMTVEFADPFARFFLAAMMAGEPVGSVLLRARRYFAERSNPLGLAYTLFGSAVTCFRPALTEMN